MSIRPFRDIKRKKTKKIKVGKVEIGEISLIVSISSPHRKSAFAACEYAIDTLKLTVPIWKKEFFQEESKWVNEPKF